MRHLLVVLSLLAACTDKTTVDPDEPSPLLGVDASATWTIPGLQAEAHVIIGEAGVPQIYAENRADLGRVFGFVAARDRYFYMDLARRQALGDLGSLLGADAVENDIEARMTGTTFIADRIVTMLELDPELKAYFEGYAEGVNAYIDEVRAGTLPPPTEYEIAYALLGKGSPIELMEPFDLRSVAAGMTVVLYESGFETKDVGRTSDAARLDGLFAGAVEEELRTAGLTTDVWNRVEPVHAVSSAPSWEEAVAAAAGNSSALPAPPHVPPGMLDRLKFHLDRVESSLGHNWDLGWGSNAWAVSAAGSADNRALVASDGHLPLSVPPLFFQVGLDTAHLGGGDIQQLGLVTPAMPLLSTGTNGDVAFGQTQLIGDITDWYTEELVLDGDGAPLASVFQGADQPLQAFDESFDVASVPLLGSAAGTVEIVRYTTFDGRWITSIEGRDVSGPADAGPGETAVNLMGDWVVPGDQDGDGIITGISFDYAGLDLSAMPQAIDAYTKAKTVQEFKEATSDLVAYSLNLVAADADGDILYTGFQATPCRRYLDRNPDGSWADGADPSMLLDGTRYGGFTIPIVDGKVDATQADPQSCIIPYDEYPHEFSPEQGYLVSANNDPGGLAFDGDLSNDRQYIGGPWQDGYRPHQIGTQLEERIAAGGVTVDGMKAVQADHTSTIGQQLAPELLQAISVARGLVGATVVDGSSEARMLALYNDHSEAIEEAATRMEQWIARGYQAESGVETFYESPTAEERDDAVATMIFNAWMTRFLNATVNDEGFVGLGFPTGTTGRFRTLTRMLDGRGPDNPLDMGSWNPETEESVYFDDRRTDVFETSTEVALAALVDAFAFLEGESTEEGRGGFGTADMDSWLWGLRHWVRFTSLLGDFFGVDDPLLGPLIEPLNINTGTFPVAENLSSTDPRASLPGFPRHGDLEGIDALNFSSDGTRYDNDYGSVFRLVVALGEGQFEAWNVIPGGQSGLVDSPHFADQARLWLGNDYIQLYLDPEEVAAHAVTRELFTP